MKRTTAAVATIALVAGTMLASGAAGGEPVAADAASAEVDMAPASGTTGSSR